MDMESMNVNASRMVAFFLFNLFFFFPHYKT